MKQYYYVDLQGNQVGPISLEQMRAANLASNTLVWCEGMAGWTALSSVEELRGAVPPVPSSPFPDPTPHLVMPKTPIKPDTNFVWALLSTLLCCMPFGIVAIVQANKVDSHWNAGRFEEAEKCSKNARMWSLISAGVGVAVIFLNILLVILTA